ncbi:uncharacterized protein LOC111365685 [Olea europaea var. sylvestris]|uniref:uncharacterized protein LOC111365685 n=1 Tax=Olea europaea var. sylvestris TaxID=158386 RepID=UPI000C1CE711|nr:uncharacterized protein LOC111365685 [Olea europaea var. sylvestris]
MLRSRTNTQAEKARPKRPIVADLSEIGITKKNLKNATDEQLSFDKKEVDPHPYHGVMVISLPVAGVTIPKVLVDTGSSLNILFSHTLKWMGIPANFLQPYPHMVLGLSGALTSAKGSIKLKVEFGSAPRQLKTNSDFVVFDTPSPYNVVMVQPLLFSLRAAIFLYSYSIKFPTPHGVGKVRENRELVERYQWKTCASHQRSSLRVHMANIWESELILLDPQTRIEGGELVEQLEGVRVCAKDKTKELKVECELQPSTRSKIVAFLKENLDVFAWDHSDMRGIDLNIAWHKLQVDHSTRPKYQKRRPLNHERYEELNKEVQKLLNNGFAREAKYPKWVANPVLVKKNTTKIGGYA